MNIFTTAISVLTSILNNIESEFDTVNTKLNDIDDALNSIKQRLSKIECSDTALQKSVSLDAVSNSDRGMQICFCTNCKCRLPDTDIANCDFCHRMMCFDCFVKSGDCSICKPKNRLTTES